MLGQTYIYSRGCLKRQPAKAPEIISKLIIFKELQ